MSSPGPGPSQPACDPWDAPEPVRLRRDPSRLSAVAVAPRRATAAEPEAETPTGRVDAATPAGGTRPIGASLSVAPARIDVSATLVPEDGVSWLDGRPEPALTTSEAPPPIGPVRPSRSPPPPWHDPDDPPSDPVLGPSLEGVAADASVEADWFAGLREATDEASLSGGGSELERRFPARGHRTTLWLLGLAIGLVVAGGSLAATLGALWATGWLPLPLVLVPQAAVEAPLPPIEPIAAPLGEASTPAVAPSAASPRAASPRTASRRAGALAGIGADVDQPPAVEEASVAEEPLEVEDVGAAGPAVVVEDVAGEDVAGEDVVVEDVAGEDVAGEDVAGEDVAGEDVAGEDVVAEPTPAGVAGEEPPPARLVSPAPPAAPAAGSAEPPPTATLRPIPLEEEAGRTD
jgi:hypothetical protein